MTGSKKQKGEKRGSVPPAFVGSEGLIGHGEASPAFHLHLLVLGRHRGFGIRRLLVRDIRRFLT